MSVDSWIRANHTYGAQQRDHPLLSCTTLAGEHDKPSRTILPCCAVKFNFAKRSWYNTGCTKCPSVLLPLYTWWLLILYIYIHIYISICIYTRELEVAKLWDVERNFQSLVERTRKERRTCKVGVTTKRCVCWHNKCLFE